MAGRGLVTTSSATPVRILHLSGDYPDPIEAFKTPVIRTLVDLTRDQFGHNVLSLNRRSPGPGALAASLIRGGGRPSLKIRSQPFDDGTAIEYFAPGRGIYHATLLRQLGDRLADEIAPEMRPDLVIGHKLAIEGIAARRMAHRLGVPFAVSIQGDTDTKILQMRPDLAPEFARAFHDAAVVFPFAPWALEKIERRLGKRSGRTIILPCPTDLDQPQTPRITGSKELVTVFHLKNHRRKNLKGMVEAMRIVARHDPDIRLTVIGGGGEDDIASCQALLNGLSNVTLAGPMNRVQLRERFLAATAFVMPSLRESFGLVFVEALFSGLPIIYPAGTAVDGFFDDAPFAMKVPAHAPDQIAKAICQSVAQEAEAKRSLATWQSSAEAKLFTRESIAAQFSAGLRAAADTRPSA